MTYKQKWYQKNKQTIAKKEAKRWKENRRHNMNRRRILILQKRKWVEDYKIEKGCCKCGIKHPAVLDLHHRNNNGEKNFMAV